MRIFTIYSFISCSAGFFPHFPVLVKQTSIITCVRDLRVWWKFVLTLILWWLNDKWKIIISCSVMLWLQLTHWSLHIITALPFKYLQINHLSWKGYKNQEVHSKPKQPQREPHGGSPKSLLACATVRKDDNSKHCHWSFAPAVQLLSYQEPVLSK